MLTLNYIQDILTLFRFDSATKMENGQTAALYMEAQIYRVLDEIEVRQELERNEKHS